MNKYVLDQMCCSQINAGPKKTDPKSDYLNSNS